MLGTPLLSCFKASGDTAKIPGSDRARSLRGIYTLDCGAQHVGLVGGPRATGYPRKLDREILADCPSAKIGSLENFRLYGKCVHLTNTTLLHFLPKRFSHFGVDGDLVALYDLVLSCDGSDSVIDFVSGEGNRPIHCIAKNITKPEQVSLIVSLCESGGHFDAVDASGKTALDYLNQAGMASHLERHIPPSPRSLMCLASCAIVKKHIPYSQMDTIPPRMKRYIALHDRQCCVYSPA